VAIGAQHRARAGPRAASPPCTAVPWNRFGPRPGPVEERPGEAAGYAPTLGGPSEHGQGLAPTPEAVRGDTRSGARRHPKRCEATPEAVRGDTRSQPSPDSPRGRIGAGDAEASGWPAEASGWPRRQAGLRREVARQASGGRRFDAQRSPRRRAADPSHPSPAREPGPRGGGLGRMLAMKLAHITKS
jgi:hypothetical protein